jgi:hypothetical protein
MAAYGGVDSHPFLGFRKTKKVEVRKMARYMTDKDTAKVVAGKFVAQYKKGAGEIDLCSDFLLWMQDNYEAGVTVTVPNRKRQLGSAFSLRNLVTVKVSGFTLPLKNITFCAGVDAKSCILEIPIDAVLIVEDDAEVDDGKK